MIVMLRLIDPMILIQPNFRLSTVIKPNKFLTGHKWSKLNLDNMKRPKCRTEHSKRFLPIHLPHRPQPQRDKLDH